MHNVRKMRIQKPFIITVTVQRLLMILMPMRMGISLIFVSLSDDPGAVYPGGAAQPAPPAGRVGVRRPGLPGSGDLRLEEEVLVLLHPPPSRHHDCQPGADHLDPQSHELHSGKGRIRGEGEGFNFHGVIWHLCSCGDVIWGGYWKKRCCRNCL